MLFKTGNTESMLLQRNKGEGPVTRRTPIIAKRRLKGKRGHMEHLNLASFLRPCIYRLFPCGVCPCSLATRQRDDEPFVVIVVVVANSGRTPTH